MLGALRRRRDGNSAVEFALAAPVLVMLAIGTFDYGAAVNLSSTLRGAARAGIQYASAHPTDAAGIQHTVLGALAAKSDDVGIDARTFCECSGAGANCGTACPDGSVNQVFMTVTVTQALVPLMPTTAFLLPSQLAGSATLRVR
jgi:Flp pilus assembly protein TadG